MSDTVSPAEFKADLAQLLEVKGKVKTQSHNIKDSMNAIAADFNGVRDVWHSPAEPTFEDMTNWFNSVANQVQEILEDITNRLQATHESYFNMEYDNVQNLSKTENLLK